MFKTLLFFLISVSSTLWSLGQYQTSNALNFDGVDDYVDLNSMRLYLDTVNDFTFEFWVQADSNDQAGNQSALLSIQRPSQSAKLILFMGGINSQEGKLLIQNDSQSQPNFISNRLIGDNQCHHIAYVEQGNVGTIYIDGLVEGTVTLNSIFGTNDQIYLGNRIVSSVQHDLFKGNLDDVRFWSIARTQTEIQSSKDQTMDTIPSSLFAYFHMDQGIASGNNTALPNTLTNPGSANNINGILTNFAKNGPTSNFVEPGCAELNYELNAGPDIDICAGESITLNAQNLNINNFQWTAVGPNGTVVTPTNSRFYAVSGFANNGVFVSDSFYVNLLPSPNLVRTPDDSICQFSESHLTASGGDEYDWGFGFFSDNDTLVVVDGDVFVPLAARNNNGCTVFDTIYIISKNAPIVTLPDSADVCRADTCQLSVSGNFNFVWNNGAQAGNSFSYVPVMSEWIEVVSTGSNGCQFQDSTFVAVIERPDFDLNLANIQICDNESFLFELPDTFSYQWNESATTNTYDSSIVFNSHQQYYITAINGKGCTTTDSVFILVKASPKVTFSGPTEICSGDSAVIEILGNGTAFDFGNGFTASNQWTYASTESQFFHYVSQNANDCKSNDSVYIEVLELPDIFAGDDTVICPQTPMLFKASGGVDYQWSSGIEQGVVFAPQTEQFFYVEGMDEFGCRNKDSLYVSFSDDVLSSVFVPEKIANVFTPNGDVFNPLYRPFRLNKEEIDELFYYVEFYQLTIVNRWGETLFQTNDLSEGWDGTHNNAQVAEGTYFAVIEYLPKCHTSDKPLKFSSSVHLIR